MSNPFLLRVGRNDMKSCGALKEANGWTDTHAFLRCPAEELMSFEKPTISPTELLVVEKFLHRNKPTLSVTKVEIIGLYF